MALASPVGIARDGELMHPSLCPFGKFTQAPRKEDVQVLWPLAALTCSSPSCSLLVVAFRSFLESLIISHWQMREQQAVAEVGGTANAPVCQHDRMQVIEPETIPKLVPSSRTASRYCGIPKPMTSIMILLLLLGASSTTGGCDVLFARASRPDILLGTNYSRISVVGLS